MDDNRQLQRFTISVPACIETARNHETGGKEYFSRDVSSGGAFFFTSNPPKVGTKVRIEMLLCRQGSAQSNSKKALVRIKGKVVRTDHVGMAIRFNQHYVISSVETGDGAPEQVNLQIVEDNVL